MKATRLAVAGAFVSVVLGACTPPRTAPAPGAGGLPPIPSRSGPLAIQVVYPGEGATLGVRDSTFVFGNVGTGQASLRINDTAVEVAPNGAFLAFLPVPADGVYQLTATAGAETAQLTRQVKVPSAPAPAAVADRLSIVPGSLMPRGAFTLEEDEPLDVSFRGTPGATARLVLPDGSTIPLVERPVSDRASGFMLDREIRTQGVSEYVGVLPARIPLVAGDTAVARPTLGTETPATTRRALADQMVRGAGAVAELIRGADTVRVPLGLSLGVLPQGSARVAVAATQRADGQVVGTAIPGGGTPYHWFFPNGTRLAVTGERAGEYRVQLTRDLSVWVGMDDVQLLPAGTPAPRGTVGTVRATAAPEFVDIRFSISERLPFRVDGAPKGFTVTIYGAETRTNWLQYGATDPLIRRMEWEQVADDLYRLHVEMARPLWGFLPFYDDAGNLVVRVRRPPDIDSRRPLAGLYIGIDAGHPPGGAIGPTGYTEAEANLAITKRLIPMLQAAGARVLEIRPDTAAVALGARPQMATDSSVHLLVSVHNNAFPDGVNPWENNGTSVFYNPAHSLDLARSLQHELLREFGLRDLGIARADLALVRPTWMPSALTETMFLMIPQQEAALRDPEVQERIARAHFRAIEAFLRGRAESTRE
jgi:N-acetylmuramoyl-L-alanine amidase